MKNYNIFKNLLVVILICVSIKGYANIGLPAYFDDDEIVQHQFYTFKYNEDREQASWVAFTLTEEMQTAQKVKRINRFKSDRDVSTESASPKDTLHRYSLTDIEPLFRMFIDDISKGSYFLHFNFRLINGQISIQPLTNVGLAITDYTDRLQGLK